MRKAFKYLLAVALGAAGGLAAAEGMALVVPGLALVTALVVSTVGVLVWCDTLGCICVEDWE